MQLYPEEGIQQLGKPNTFLFKCDRLFSESTCPHFKKKLHSTTKEMFKVIFKNSYFCFRKANGNLGLTIQWRGCRVVLVAVSRKSGWTLCPLKGFCFLLLKAASDRYMVPNGRIILRNYVLSTLTKQHWFSLF